MIFSSCWFMLTLKTGFYRVPFQEFLALLSHAECAKRKKKTICKNMLKFTHTLKYWRFLVYTNLPQHHIIFKVYFKLLTTRYFQIFYNFSTNVVWNILFYKIFGLYSLAFSFIKNISYWFTLKKKKSWIRQKT